MAALVAETPLASVCAKGLRFAYPGKEATLHDLSFTIAPSSRVLLTGATGSGKSTLLRCLKPELTFEGSLSGEVLVLGRPAHALNAQLSAGIIGFVMQDPHEQIVMDTVKAELAFGLENLGTPPELIQRRVAEIAHYFGINAWVERKTSELSGGQKQLVNLAAVMAMQPHILLLDEPTAALDPLAAKEFMELLLRLNEELGITTVVVEHRLEDVLSQVDQVLFLHEGSLAFDGSPRLFARWLHTSGSPHHRALPASARLCLRQEEKQAAVRAARHETKPASGCFEGDEQRMSIPLNVREGRLWLAQQLAPSFSGKESAPLSLSDIEDLSVNALALPFSERCLDNALAGFAPGGAFLPGEAPAIPAFGTTVLEAKHVWYRYGKASAYVLRDLSLKLTSGSILGIVGANASGKSTLLTLLFGAEKPQHGKLRQAAGMHVALLPQDPTLLFLHDTVHEELMEHAEAFGYDFSQLEALLARMKLEDKQGAHPLDLSGGQQQNVALAKLLLTAPDILLLDEPCSGLDVLGKAELAGILKELSALGKTVVIVSHDLEFIAATTNECLMLFNGAVVGQAPTSDFFTGNLFYTTALTRITQGILKVAPSCA